MYREVCFAVDHGEPEMHGLRRLDKAVTNIHYSITDSQPGHQSFAYWSSSDKPSLSAHQVWEYGH
jgi:hypothetical protein